MAWLQHLGTVLAAVPATIWAAIIAVSGVLISNRHSRKRLQIQLNHEAEQRDRDRLMTLRKDVFLKAADGISQGSAALGGLLDLSVPNVDLGVRSRSNMQLWREYR